MTSIRKISSLLLGVALALFFIVGVNHSSVKAATQGWLWGGTPSADGAYRGAGFISTSNASDNSSNPYSVTVPVADADLSGYAWTPYYGWLSFNVGELGGCPIPDINGKCHAYRQGSAIKGWAKFLALGNNGTVTNGWVSLSGTGYGIGTGVNYAWSDDLGWIDIAGLMNVPTVQINFQ